MLRTEAHEIRGVNPHDIITISEEEFLSDIKLHEKLSQAARMGIFYLEIPTACKPLIEKVISFTNAFYLDTNIKELKLTGFSGYHERDNSQIEALYVERAHWQDILPFELVLFASKTHELAIEVIKKTLSALGISNENYGKVTGNVTNGGGDVFFTFNHYSTEKSSEGLASHRDFGQITVLFTNKSGLQAKINEDWVDVNPRDEYFIINFGKALEKTINNPSQLTAVWHRVQKVVEDRISFVIAAGNDGNSLIYQKNHNGEIISTGELYLTVLQASRRYKKED